MYVVTRGAMKSFKGDMQDLLPDMCVCVRAHVWHWIRKWNSLLLNIYIISSNENVFKVLILVSVLANRACSFN